MNAYPEPFDDWYQASLYPSIPDTAEQVVARELLPILARSEDAGTIVDWFFVRKTPEWRVRLRPARADRHRVESSVRATLNALCHNGDLTSWVETIYEPETHAFGGPDAMPLAHQHFTADSRAALSFLADVANGRPDHRHEVSLLLCSLLLRSAGLDWYEQGDVWARIANHRAPPPEQQVSDLRSKVHTFLTADAGPHSPLFHDEDWQPLSPWATAMETTGNAFGEYARSGHLRRGLRHILVHHVLFHWNRLGVSHRTQSILAHTAATAVFDTDIWTRAVPQSFSPYQYYRNDL